MVDKNTGELRRKIERWIESIPRPNSSATDLIAASDALEAFRLAAAASAANAFDSFEQGQAELQEEIGPAFRATEYLPDLLALATLAQVDDRRIEIATEIASVADSARTRGLWIEFLLLRSLTWMVAEPTGIAIVAFRQQMYSDPVTNRMLGEFYRGDCGPIGAATDLASLTRELSEVVHRKTSISPGQAIQ